MLKEKLDKILLKVQKPSRYIGGEVNAVVKDKSKVDIRFAFCFPDTYDIGMSHLGIKILYSLKNSVSTLSGKIGIFRAVSPLQPSASLPHTSRINPNGTVSSVRFAIWNS